MVQLLLVARQRSRVTSLTTACRRPALGLRRAWRATRGLTTRWREVSFGEPKKFCAAGSRAPILILFSSSATAKFCWRPPAYFEAGKFLFLSGVRTEKYAQAISLFLGRYATGR